MPMILSQGKSYFEYQFITTFEETNLVGNIYFANYVLWQGKCREMFLYEYCPDVIAEINEGLLLITLDLSMQYISQLFAFDTVVMRMSLAFQSGSRLLITFDYYKQEQDKALTLVARGTQATAAMKMIKGKISPVDFPDSMLQMFEEYQWAHTT